MILACERDSALNGLPEGEFRQISPWLFFLGDYEDEDLVYSTVDVT